VYSPARIKNVLDHMKEGHNIEVLSWKVQIHEIAWQHLGIQSPRRGRGRMRVKLHTPYFPSPSLYQR
jgi:hypothetical protein